MESINESIIELIKKELNLENIETDRRASRRKTGFYVEIDPDNRYIFTISDVCMDFKKEKILNAIKEKAIPLLKKNPNKEVIMKSNLSVDVNNVE